jgi:sugar phosphate isomerase/epimerase
VNELDGTEPGFRDYDFESLLRTLAEIGYEGWVSVEAFDFSRPSEAIAAGAFRRLQGALPAESAMSQNS